MLDRAPGRTFNIATELVDRHVAEGRGLRPALQLAHQQRDVSYAELQALVNRAGNVLLEAGIQPEQRVAIVLPDGPEFVATFIGAMKIGAVPVPMNTAARPSELQYMLSDSRARVLVTDETLAPSSMPSAVRVILSPDLAAASTDLPTVATGVDEPCYWLYSSGTTGQPKAVVHLHGDMLACVAPYATEVVGIRPEDSTFSVARLFFSYGLVNSLFLPLLAGATAVLTPQRPDVAHTLEVVRAQRPTLFFSVPTSYAQLCSDASTRDAFKSVRLAVSAGEPLPAPLYQRWTSTTGVEVLDGLGSTEVGYIFCSNLPGRVRPGSSGVLIGDHRARILSDTGQDAPEGEIGELWVQARSTALHYWNQRERSKRAFVGEWLRTGDRYARDADGYFWYQGRVDDVLKVSGQWVSPLELESCLLQHPGVLECAVVGALDDSGLSKPKAYVVRREGSAVEAAELQALARERLLPHKYPRWVEFVPDLPKTATGKIQRFRLR